MFLAEQLRHYNGEVIYLDFSHQSMAISQERAKIRKLKNIIFIHDWIESIGKLGLYKVSYIQTSGVLHHLKNPNLGVKRMKDILDFPGGMNVMLYGKCGRAHIYQIQRVFKIILNSTYGGKKVETFEEKLRISKYMLQILPSSNWLMSSKVEWRRYGYVDIYDLFLHQRDTSFLTKDVINFSSINGLHFVEYSPNLMDNSAIISTKTGITLLDLPLAHTKQGMSSIQIMRIKEIFTSTTIKHCFYISNVMGSQADINNLDNIVYVHGNPIGIRHALLRTRPTKNAVLSALVSPFNAPSIANIDASQIKREKIIAQGGGFSTFQVPIPNKISYAMLNLLMRSDFIMREGVPIKKLYETFLKVPSTNITMLIPDSVFVPMYNVLKSVGILLLKADGVVSSMISKSLSFYVFKPET